MWSLSVELQFYILAPLLLALLGRLPSVEWRLAMLGSLVVVSCCSQTLSAGNFEHMALVNRIWQFALGFIAFELSQMTHIRCHPTPLVSTIASVKSISALPSPSFHSTNWKCHDVVDRGLYYGLPLLIVVGVCVPLYSWTVGMLLKASHIQGDRVLLLGLVVVLLARGKKHAALSSTTLGTFVGDTSYSIYLCHWPLFVLARYMKWTSIFTLTRKLGR